MVPNRGRRSRLTSNRPTPSKEFKVELKRGKLQRRKDKVLELEDSQRMTLNL